MFKNKNHKLAWFTLLLWAGVLHAQNTSVGELIEKTKAARAAELMGSSSKNKDAAAHKSKAPPVLVKPKVWSIAGVNDDLEAVLVSQEKAYLIRASKLPATLGPWQVTSIKEQEVWIKEANATKSAKQIIALEGPSKDTSLEGFAQALNIQLVLDENGALQPMTPAPNQISMLATQPAPLPPAGQRPERVEPGANTKPPTK